MEKRILFRCHDGDVAVVCFQHSRNYSIIMNTDRKIDILQAAADDFDKIGEDRFTGSRRDTEPAFLHSAFVAQDGH